MNRRLFLIIVLFIFPVFLFSHGAKISYEINSTIDIIASYDTGTPMSDAQVLVYAPGNPSEPWLKGSCDSDGCFSFTPDTAFKGIWDVQVRKAGHGDMVHIDLKGNAKGSTGYSPLQIILMVICFLWGCTGTALFFIKKNYKKD